MKLFEYQAKELFEELGVPTPKGRLISGVSELDGAVEEIGFPCVIKAQVLRGGRGKAGLIQFASSAKEIRTKAERVFDSLPVGHSLLIEQALDIDKELYLSITAESVSGSALVMISAEGGVEIEELARTMPGKIIKERVDLSEGLLPFQARNAMFELGLDKEGVRQGSVLLLNLYELFREYDAELVEINPLVVTRKGALVAADAKVTIDDSSLHRQTRFPLSRNYFESDVAYEAAVEGIPYLEFDGEIGLMCAGSGLTNVIYDLVNQNGGSVSSYVEFGGPNYRKAAKAMELTMQIEPKVVLIVTFGTIARADVIAEDLAKAIEQLKPEFPIVTAIRGTGEERVPKLLRGVGLEPLDDTEDAVEKAIELARSSRR